MEQNKYGHILSPWHWYLVWMTEGLRERTPFLEWHKLGNDWAESPFFPNSQGKRKDNVSSVFNMTLKKKEDKEYTGPQCTPLTPPFLPLLPGYQRMPLWPHFQHQVQLIPCSALFFPTLGATAPNLNAYSSAADMLASAWNKDSWRSARMNTLLVCGGQVIHTASSSSKAHSRSDVNLGRAITGLGSLP